MIVKLVAPEVHLNMECPVVLPTTHLTSPYFTSGATLLSSQQTECSNLNSFLSEFKHITQKKCGDHTNDVQAPNSTALRLTE